MVYGDGRCDQGIGYYPNSRNVTPPFSFIRKRRDVISGKASRMLGYGCVDALKIFFLHICFPEKLNNDEDKKGDITLPCDASITGHTQGRKVNTPLPPPLLRNTDASIVCLVFTEAATRGYTRKGTLCLMARESYTTNMPRVI